MVGLYDYDANTLVCTTHLTHGSSVQYLRYELEQTLTESSRRLVFMLCNSELLPALEDEVAATDLIMDCTSIVTSTLHGNNYRIYIRRLLNKDEVINEGVSSRIIHMEIKMYIFLILSIIYSISMHILPMYIM
jgi:hypothetical protein